MFRNNSINYFSIVGAQRSGSTFLYNLLDSHPEIYMAKPVKPEPKFFYYDEEYAKGLNYYNDKYFSNIPLNIKCIGEKSTTYFESEKAAIRIKESIPDSKILIILRNPIDRTISNYFFSLNNKLESRSITDVFINKKKEPIIEKFISVSPFNYIGRSLYSKYLTFYKQLFNDNLYVIIFEELIEKNDELDKILEFLGLSSFKKIDRERLFTNKTVYTSNKYEIENVRNELKKIFISEINRLEIILNKKLDIWKK